MSWLSNLVDSVTEIPSTICSFLDYTFNPCSEQFDEDFGIACKNEFANKFGFVENIKTAFNNFANQNSPLTIDGDLTFGDDTFGNQTYSFSTSSNSKVLTFVEAYEPYRVRVRSGLDVVLRVASFLAILNIAFRTFGLSLLGKFSGSVVSLSSPQEPNNYSPPDYSQCTMPEL